MPAGISRFVTSRDGLKLHLRDYDPGWPGRVPVVCLPGLSRTSDDFERVADRLSSGAAAPPRRVIAIDYRGRGLSAWDPDPRNYDLKVESEDIHTILRELSVPDAIVIGTSRGGLHAMLLAATEPALLRGVVLNDIGPVLAAEGLARIKGYIGKAPDLSDWADAVAALRRTTGGHFTGLSDDEWDSYARLTFAEANGSIGLRYDPALSHNFANFDPATIPELWPQFDSLGHVPLLVIRGSNSDLLSQETADKMVRRHPAAELAIVDGQGHAPLLRDEPTLRRIVAFVERCDPAKPEAERRAP
ncbi:MAG: alpha/beta hydrolase [Parafilimonas terrae]|nr:alpha/beta hydrolase [Parafilimonas terrae]